MGDWSYINTEWVPHSNGIRVRLKVPSLSGLGLLEYLYWCEDLDMQPIMAVWAGEWYPSNASLQYIYFSGFSLSGQSLPENQLAPYIQQAIDQVGSHFDLWYFDLTATISFRWTSWLETLQKAKLVYLFPYLFFTCTYIFKLHDEHRSAVLNHSHWTMLKSVTKIFSLRPRKYSSLCSFQGSLADWATQVHLQVAKICHCFAERIS